MAAPGAARRAPHELDTSWEGVAEWYDDLVDERGSDYHRNIVIPGALRLLGNVRHKRVLDVACGQGVLCRELKRLGASVVGIDSSPALIEQARRRSGTSASAGLRSLERLDPNAPISFFVVDARDLDNATGGDGSPPGRTSLFARRSYDAVCCILSIQNIDPIGPVFAGVARLLRPSGCLVIVMLHPAFRAIGQTAWGWDERQRRQFRRVDGYLTPGESAVRIRPGADPALTTLTFHRPLQSYFHELAAAGLMVDALEEWPSHRRSPPSPRAAEEDRARREIPLFLGLRARKPAGA